MNLTILAFLTSPQSLHPKDLGEETGMGDSILFEFSLSNPHRSLGLISEIS